MAVGQTETPRRIGYLIPEFPGQTHIFIWREMHALRRLNIETELISTRRPPKGVVAHNWSGEAISKTFYLVPLSAASAAGSTLNMLRAGPVRWWRCVAAACKADGLSVGRKLRLAAMIPIGAALAWLARKQGWNHCHVHSCGDAANIAMFAKLLGGPSYSMTLHGALGDYGGNQRQKWGHAAFAVSITGRLLEQVRAAVDGAMPAVIDIAPMGVDTDRVKRSKPYEPWSGSGAARIFCCGRLNAGKGHDHLIRAIRLLREQQIDAQLEIAGEDDDGGVGYRKVLEALISELSLNAHVRLLGAIAENQVLAKLESAHLFALASLHEALGVAIMEAMAMETPVVVTRTGGVPDVVSDGVEGLMVETGNPLQLSEGMATILKDPELATKLGLAGREKVIQRFSSNLSAAAIARCLEKTSQSRRDKHA